MKEKVCGCGKRLKTSEKNYFQGERVCNSCYWKEKKGKTDLEEVKKDRVETVTPVKVALPLPTMSPDHSKCFLCNGKRTSKRVLSQVQRREILVRWKVFAPNSARCCVDHFSGDNFADKLPKFDFEHLKKFESLLSAQEILDVINLAHELTKEEKKILSFDVALSDDDCVALTGLKYADVKDLADSCSLQDGKICSKFTAVRLLLVKLKTNLSLKQLKILFGFKDKLQVSGIIITSPSSIALRKDFVPRYLGFSAISRESVASLS